MLNPVLSPTRRHQCALVVPWHHFCAEHTQSITKSLYFTKTMFYCKDQCQESIQKMWMTHKTQLGPTTSTTQTYSATAAKVVAKLLQKVILMLEKAAILKNGRHLRYIRSRKIKIQIPHSQRYMIWYQYHSNMTSIWGFIQKRIFWYSKYRPSWHFDRLKFFSKKVAHKEYSCQFWCLIWKITQKKRAYNCPTMHCRSLRIFTMFRLLCKYDFESMTVYPSR